MFLLIRQKILLTKIEILVGLKPFNDYLWNFRPNFSKMIFGYCLGMRVYFKVRKWPSPISTHAKSWWLSSRIKRILRVE